MNMVHLHLLLNHVPVVGAALVVALLMLATFRNSSPLAKTALGVAVAIGLLSLVVFVTGEPAEEAVERLADVSEPLIERHESAALLATIAASAFGVAALGVLAWFKGRSITRFVTATTLVGSLILAAAMAWTANLGGQIRHSEIRSGVVATRGSASSADEDRQDERKTESKDDDRRDR